MNTYTVVIENVKTDSVTMAEYWVYNVKTKAKHSSWKNLIDARKAANDLNAMLLKSANCIAKDY